MYFKKKVTLLHVYDEITLHVLIVRKVFKGMSSYEQTLRVFLTTYSYHITVGSPLLHCKHAKTVALFFEFPNVCITAMGYENSEV